MTLVAALAMGCFFGLLAATLSGTFPRRIRVDRRVRERTHREWLQQAGSGMSAAQFWFGCLAVGGVSFLVLAALTHSVFVAIVPATAVALIPRAYFGHRRAVRMRAVQAAWPDGVRDLIASIAAGRSLSQSVAALATTGPAPLREALGRFPDLARMLGTPAALEVVKAELSDPTSDRILEVLIVANERGGGIVRSILEDLVSSTTRDLKMIDEIETDGLEMKINARAVVVLPWLVLVVLTARPGAFRDFYRSGGGIATLLAGAALSAVGVLVLGRLARRPEEIRVFSRQRIPS